MVKAALLQGEIGTSAGGAHVCVKPLLGDTFRLCQWLAESWRSAEAEPLLLEVQQVTCPSAMLMLVEDKSMTGLNACNVYCLALCF